MHNAIRTALLLALAVPAYAAPPTPDMHLIDRIERTVTLPAGAGPIGDYARFYALTTLRHISAAAPDDRPILSAVYIRGEGAPGRIMVTPETMPRPARPGCDVVTLYYDIQGERWSGIHCNPAR